MIIDADRLRKLRRGRGWSQETLATLCKVNRRTIQRAEAGSSIALETASFIAAELGLASVDQLRAHSTATNLSRPDAPDSAVVLNKTMSGRKVIRAILRCFDTAFEYEVEPLHGNVEVLSKLADRLSSAYSDPNLPFFENPQLKEAQILRLQADVNNDLQALSELGINAYLVEYCAERVVPRYDPVEGCMATYVGQATEFVDVALIIVSDTPEPYLVRRPSDKQIIPF